MYLYKCWQEFFSVDEQQHRTSVTRTREGEDEHTETPETVASGGAGLGKGDTGKKGKGKGKGKTKSKGKPTPSGAPKPKKEKTQDQLARNVPRLSCFFFIMWRLFVTSCHYNVKGFACFWKYNYLGWAW